MTTQRKKVTAKSKKLASLKELSKNEYIMDNIGLVHKEARKYQKYANGTSIDYEDLVQEGTIGLMIAYDKFKPKKGFQFSTYATYWIKARILRLLSRFYSIIHVTYSAGAIYDQLLTKYKKKCKETELAVTDIISKLTEDYSAGKLSYAEYTKFINVLEAKQPLSFTHIPLNTSGGNFTNTEYLSSAMNTFSEHSENTSSNHVSDKLQYIENIDQILGQKSVLSRVLEELTEKENKFITLYYGLNNNKPHTYGTLSKILGIQKSNMKKFHTDTIQKLKDIIKDWVLSGDLAPEDVFGSLN